MIFQFVLASLVIPSSAAVDLTRHTIKHAVTEQSHGKEKSMPPASGQSEKALRGTVFAVQPHGPVGDKPAPGQDAAGEPAASSSNKQQYIRIAVQLIFGLVYYFLIVKKYPELKDTQPSNEAIELQKENEISAIFKVSGRNCVLSWCCSGPRAAHTFHSVGVLDYWPGLCMMALLPCCTLWLMNAVSDLNVKLGGDRRSFFMSCLCACCCCS